MDDCSVVAAAMQYTLTQSIHSTIVLRFVHEVCREIGAHLQGFPLALKLLRGRKQLRRTQGLTLRLALGSLPQQCQRIVIVLPFSLSCPLLPQ